MSEGRFKYCKVTGKLFFDTEGVDISPEVQDEFASRLDYANNLQKVKNAIKDHSAKGELLSVLEVSKITEVSEVEIYIAIYKGDLSTMDLDDPKVREYKLNRQRIASASTGGLKGIKPKPSKPDIGGFHGR